MMAQRKKRATLGKRKSTARSQGGKTRKPTRGKAAKPTAAKSKPGKRLAKTMPERTGAKKRARKRARPVKPPSTSTVETVSVDTIEEAAPGEITISEFEETEVRDEGEGPERLEENTSRIRRTIGGRHQQTFRLRITEPPTSDRLAYG